MFRAAASVSARMTEAWVEVVVLSVVVVATPRGGRTQIKLTREREDGDSVVEMGGARPWRCWWLRCRGDDLLCTSRVEVEVTGGAWGDKGERRIIRPQRRWRQAFPTKKKAYTRPKRVLTWHTP